VTHGVALLLRVRARQQILALRRGQGQMCQVALSLLRCVADLPQFGGNM